MSNSKEALIVILNCVLWKHKLFSAAAAAATQIDSCDSLPLFTASKNTHQCVAVYRYLLVMGELSCWMFKLPYVCKEFPRGRCNNKTKNENHTQQTINAVRYAIDIYCNNSDEYDGAATVSVIFCC